MTPSILFRELSELEKLEFRQWARDTFDVRSPINELWHPVVVAECEDMVKEASLGIFTLTPKMIDGFFEKAITQYDYYWELYKVCIHDLDNIAHIRNWPIINEVTYDYIMQKARDFDERVHPEVMKGGLWMNSGFQISNGGIADWRISMANCRVGYKPKASEE